jgi:hypothetical protein
MEGVRLMLDEIEDRLASAPLTEHVRELQMQALECRNAVASWLQRTPPPAERDRLITRIASLLGETMHVTERSQGPHSTKIKIV